MPPEGSWAFYDEAKSKNINLSLCRTWAYLRDFWQYNLVAKLSGQDKKKLDVTICQLSKIRSSLQCAKFFYKSCQDFFVL